MAVPESFASTVTVYGNIKMADNIQQPIVGLTLILTEPMRGRMWFDRLLALVKAAMSTHPPTLANWLMHTGIPIP